MTSLKFKSDELREKAESLLQKLPTEKALDAHADLLQVLHELHVHQIELELQNEELLRTHKALEQSREDYMRLYHNAPVGYVVLDQSGITRKVNRTFAEMVGGDPVAINDKPFADFLMAEDRPVFRARLKAFYKNPHNKQIDVRLLRNDVPFHVSLRAMTEEKQQEEDTHAELLVTITDINERQKYQSALEWKKRELEDILSSISDGFIALDPDFKVHYFNSAAEKILGVSRKEVLKRNLFDAFPVARGSEFEHQYTKALKEKKVLHFETHFTIPPFSDWYEVSVYPYDHGLSVFFKVITERKDMEQKLQDSKRALALYYDIATIFLTEENDNIFHEVLNLLLQTFNSDLGFIGYISPEGNLVCPTMTRHVWDQCQIPDKDIVFPRDCWAGLWGKCLIERRSLIANEDLRSPAGHIIMRNAMAAPLIHRDKVIGQFVLANKEGGYNDYDLELLENAAHQTAPILHSMLEKMEQEKLKSKLEQVNKELHKIESLNRMAGAIAHNYNNLLTIVMGGIEMALEDLPAESQRAKNSLNYALQASGKGGKIGEMLLMYLGQSQGKETLVDLVHFIEDFLLKYRQDNKAEVQLHYDTQQQLPVLKIDPRHIETILDNLISNASEAQDEDQDPVRVQIYTAAPDSIFAHRCFPMEWKPSGESYICIEVCDYGYGIKDENIEKLFDPYYSDKFTGRGMGLSMVLGLVQIYNGVVTVESEVGKGSNFRVYIPSPNGSERKNL